MLSWPDVMEHIDQLAKEECCKASAAKCRRAVGLDDSGKLLPGGKAIEHKVKVELAASIDFGRRIRDVCLHLEADHHVGLSAYDMLLEIECGMRQISWVNVQAVSAEHHGKLLPEGAPNRTSLLAAKLKEDLALAQCVVDPAIKYFESHFGPISPKAGAEAGEMSHLVSFFKYARIVDPFKARLLLHVDDADDADVRAGERGMGLIKKLADFFPSLKNNADLITSLQSEMAKYVTKARYARLEQGLTEAERSAAVSLWWAEHAVELPAWAQLAARVFLVSPTSAAVERVFSILRDSFHHGQNGALEDYVESSLMLQYNNRPGSGLPKR